MALLMVIMIAKVVEIGEILVKNLSLIWGLLDCQTVGYKKGCGRVTAKFNARAKKWSSFGQVWFGLVIPAFRTNH